MDKILQKALEPYSGAFLIKVIWGDIPKEEMPKYRLRIMNRKSGKIRYSYLEKEKLYRFLEDHKNDIDILLTRS